MGLVSWLTVSEILREQLPGAPRNERAVQLHFVEVKKQWSGRLWRKRAHVPRLGGGSGTGPGGGAEIHYTALPLEAVVAYEARNRAALGSTQVQEQRIAAGFSGRIFCNAEGGKLRAFILRWLVIEPREPVTELHRQCLWTFGKEVVVLMKGTPLVMPMPTESELQKFVTNLREAGSVDLRR